MTREERLEQMVKDWAQHDSWRCYSSLYPGECCCGLDDELHAVGLKTWADEGVERIQ